MFRDNKKWFLGVLTHTVRVHALIICMPVQILTVYPARCILYESRYLNKLATIVEGDPKAPFSIATTPRCRGGRNSIPWIAPLYP